MKNTKFAQKFYIGNHNNEKIYLSPPSWNCGWYWGFGYLGNKNCHYHVDGLTKHEHYNTDKECWEYEFTNLFDGFKKHFTDLQIRESKLWTLCELFQTFYTLKETAEVLGRGGAHYAKNPCADIIINKDEVKRINEIVLPSVFDAIFDLLKDGENIATQNKTLVNIFKHGGTQKTVNFMIEYGITTDDLKNIDGINKYDYSVLHSAYWTTIHAKK